jgi:hypothetical protein
LQCVLFWIAVTLAPPDTSQILVKGPDATWAWTIQTLGWSCSDRRDLYVVEGSTVTAAPKEKSRKPMKVDVGQYVQGVKDHDWKKSPTLKVQPGASLAKEGETYVYTLDEGSDTPKRYVIRFRRNPATAKAFAAGAGKSAASVTAADADATKAENILSDDFDAVVNDASRAFTRQKKSPEKFVYGKLTLDSKGKVVSTIYKEGLVTEATKVVMGAFDEKKKKWVPREAVEGGVGGDIFREAGKVLQVRISVGNDKKTINQILVKKTDERLVMADLEFDAVLKQVGPQTNGRGGIWYARLELDEKGGVVKTFPLKSGLVTKDTKIVMGKYSEKEKKWEAGEAVPKGLYGDIFKDLGAKTVYVRTTFRDDRKAISQILVRQVGEKARVPEER